MFDMRLDVNSVPLYREISDIQRRQIPFALVLAQNIMAAGQSDNHHSH